MGSGGVGGEVGLFAMKRDQVYKHLKPFEDAGLESWLDRRTDLGRERDRIRAVCGVG